MGPLALIYVIGAAVGVAAVDAPPGRRIGVALAWPLGVVAFVVTITALTAAALVLFPLVGAAVAAGAALWWTLA